MSIETVPAPATPALVIHVIDEEGGTDDGVFIRCSCGHRIVVTFDFIDASMPAPGMLDQSWLDMWAGQSATKLFLEHAGR